MCEFVPNMPQTPKFWHKLNFCDTFFTCEIHVDARQLSDHIATF